MAGIFKYIIVALFAFAAYNEFVLMHRESAFNEIAYRSDKALVVSQMGEPQFSYHCGTNEPVSALLPYIDSMCKEKVEEVYAFPLCRLPFRCPGWSYVAFDHNGKSVNKYRLTN